jgi:hypothetical protein
VGVKGDLAVGIPTAFAGTVGIGGAAGLVAVPAAFVAPVVPVEVEVVPVAPFVAPGATTAFVTPIGG